MKAKIFSFVKVSDESMVASARIARFIAETLSLPICWDESVNHDALDVLVIVGGAYAFAGNSILEALGNAIFLSDRVIWVQNDYTVIPPKDESGATSPFRAAFRNRRKTGKLPVDYWTTVESMSTPGRHVVDRTGNGWHCGPGSFWINWNALTFDTSPLPKKLVSVDYDDSLLYYGSFRKDRERYFNRYFLNPEVKTIISSPTKKFEQKYARCIHEAKISDTSLGQFCGFRQYLRQCGLGLYVEDEKSHSSFHSPANRFYEMLSAGLPMVFQPECQKMLDKAGYDISDFVAYNTADVAHHMGRRDMNDDGGIGAEQRRRWQDKAKNEHDALAPTLVQKWEEYL